MQLPEEVIDVLDILVNMWKNKHSYKKAVSYNYKDNNLTWKAKGLQKPTKEIFIELFNEYASQQKRFIDIAAKKLIEIERLEIDNRLINLRKKRNNVLKNSDWIFLADSVIDRGYKKYYKEYRQYLRDLPQKNKQAKRLTDYEFLNFEDWLRNNYASKFLDGGKAEIIIKHFMSQQD